jgi:hypothetical protein
LFLLFLGITVMFVQAVVACPFPDGPAGMFIIV